MWSRIRKFTVLIIISTSACSSIDKRVENISISDKKVDSLHSNAKVDSIRYVDIDHDIYGKLLDCGDTIKRQIHKEFVLADTISTIYSLEIHEYEPSFLKFRENDQWFILDTLETKTILFTRLDCTSDFPIFEITDFNKDGYPDLVAKLLTNCNGNIWTKLFLFNLQTKKLNLIKSAEYDGIWAAPEFHANDSTINCQEVASAFGIDYISKYKLIGLKVIPIEKEVEDRSSGKDIITIHFKGVNGKWKKAWKHKN